MTWIEFSKKAIKLRLRLFIKFLNQWFPHEEFETFKGVSTLLRLQVKEFSNFRIVLLEIENFVFFSIIPMHLLVFSLCCPTL